MRNTMKIKQKTKVQEEINSETVKQIAKHMISNKEETLEIYLKFEKEIQKVFQSRHEFIGRVLKSHLIIEKHLNDCLLHSYGKNFEDLNLKFHQKLILIELNDNSLKFCLYGIRELNKIRNRIAHKLDTKVLAKDIPFMKKYVEFIEGINLSDPIKVIEKFTNYACIWLSYNISNTGIKRNSEIKEIINSTSIK